MLTLGNIDFRVALTNFFLVQDNRCIPGSREHKVLPPKREMRWAQVSLTVSPRSSSGVSLPPSVLMSFLVLGPSLFKGSELVEGMPEEGWLPLGFCQGKDLLLRDAGRHRDVSLVKGMQGLVWRRHRTPIIAHTCRKTVGESTWVSQGNVSTEPGDMMNFAVMLNGRTAMGHLSW